MYIIGLRSRDVFEDNMVEAKARGLRGQGQIILFLKPGLPAVFYNEQKC